MIELAPVAIPDFGIPLAPPAIPAETLAARCDRLFERAGADWVVVYADREHYANIVHLAGFEPRFEEALLLLGSKGRRILVTGNESESYAAISPLKGLDVVLAQSLSLMAQDRTSRPNLAAVLAGAGIASGDSIGLVGWKYLASDEGDGFLVPHSIVRSLETSVGPGGTLADATSLLMHPETGDRATVDADQLAQFEWGAARASAASWRIVNSARPGMAELDLATRFGYAGEPMSCHPMLASATGPAPVIGLRSPSARLLRQGDGITTAIGYWGGLSSRAALLDTTNDAFLDIAKAYFTGLLSWYETAAIGVTGGDIHAAVVDTLGRGGLRSMLNPGHLVSYDEWSHSPIRPGSTERIRSGMPFQVDIIPAPLPSGWALNAEDTVVFADAALRQSLRERHPEVAARIDARRAFLAAHLGVALADEILPLSNIPLCVAPFWLRADHLLVRR